MYRLHKENPEVYTIERLAKDYRVMRQRVHAILWLKEMEEEEEKKLGKPLDDSVEILLDTFPEYVLVFFLVGIVSYFLLKEQYNINCTYEKLVSCNSSKTWLTSSVSHHSVHEMPNLYLLFLTIPCPCIYRIRNTEKKLFFGYL